MQLHMKPLGDPAAMQCFWNPTKAVQRQAEAINATRKQKRWGPISKRIKQATLINQKKSQVTAASLLTFFRALKTILGHEEHILKQLLRWDMISEDNQEDYKVIQLYDLDKVIQQEATTENVRAAKAQIKELCQGHEKDGRGRPENLHQKKRKVSQKHAF